MNLEQTITDVWNSMVKDEGEGVSLINKKGPEFESYTKFKDAYFDSEDRTKIFASAMMAIAQKIAALSMLGASDEKDALSLVRQNGTSAPLMGLMFLAYNVGKKEVEASSQADLLRAMFELKMENPSVQSNN